MLHTADCLLVADVSVQPIGPIFKGQTVFLHCLAHEDGTDGSSRNVGSYLRHRGVCVCAQVTK
jgi:hypothetical protein